MKEFKDVYRILCRSVLPCLSIQAAMRNFYIWCQNHSQALHREKSTKIPHKSGSVHSGVDRGIFLTSKEFSQEFIPHHNPQSHYNTMSSWIFFDIKEWEKYGWRSNNISMHSLQVSLAHTQNGLWGLGPMQGKSFFFLRIHMKRNLKTLASGSKVGTYMYCTSNITAPNHY